MPASEFTRKFGRYRTQAQRQPIAVSRHGQITVYFVAPGLYEEMQRFMSRSFATAELPDEKVKAIAASKMDARRAHLDAILTPSESHWHDGC